MEAIVLKAIAGELRRRLVPARLAAVHQAGSHCLFLEFRAGREGRLLVCADPAGPRIFRVGKKPAGPPSPASFFRLLRKRLTGTVLTALESPGMERTVEFYFAPTAADTPRLKLVAEMTGRHSNLILVEEPSGLIADSLRHVTSRISRLRTILPGDLYQPPPTGGRKDLFSLGAGEFAVMYESRGGGGKKLVSSTVGLGPGFLTAGEETARRDSGKADPSGEEVYRALEGLRRTVEDGRIQAVAYVDRGLILPFPVPGWEDEPQRTFSTVDEAVEKGVPERLPDRERERLLAVPARELKNELRRLDRAIARAEGEAGDLAGAEEMIAAGKGIIAALGEIPRGASSFLLTDSADPERAPVVVKLDPAVSPRGNAEKMFRKAKKLRRREELARERLPRLQGERRKTAAELEALQRLSIEELRDRKRGRPEKGGRRKGSPAASGRVLPGIREFLSDEGWRVLVGKSGRGNDYLTFRGAAPEDYWFHARGWPGAHVVLKAAGGKGEPPEEVVRDAAALAAWYSGARSETMADVAWTLRKHVRRVKGKSPGKVLLSRERIVRVAPGRPARFKEK